MDITVVVSLLVLEVKTKMFFAACLQIDKVVPKGKYHLKLRI
jgi:hypothetical protein